MATEATYYGTGKRKTSIARVYLTPGDGAIEVNGKPLNTYFGRPVLQTIATMPLAETESQARYNIKAMICGGGPQGQAGALRHGIARALIEADEGLRPALKKAGFLTRDPREKERRKAGFKKARKRPQFSKR